MGCANMEKEFSIKDCNAILDRFYKNHELNEHDESELNSLVDRIDPRDISQYPDITFKAVLLSASSKNADKAKITRVLSALDNRSLLKQKSKFDNHDDAIYEYSKGNLNPDMQYLTNSIIRLLNLPKEPERVLVHQDKDGNKHVITREMIEKKFIKLQESEPKTNLFEISKKLKEMEKKSPINQPSNQTLRQKLYSSVIKSVEKSRNLAKEIGYDWNEEMKMFVDTKSGDVKTAQEMGQLLKDMGFGKDS